MFSDQLQSAQFRESSQLLGLQFQHFAHQSKELHLPEIVGSGVAIFDYDLDGDMDVFVVQGHKLGAHPSMATIPPAHLLKDRFFHNQLIETGTPGFIDATDRLGLNSDGFGMGVAIADINRDGYPDLFVTNLGRNRLLLNRGGTSFSDISDQKALKAQAWSTSACFFDFNGDGLPDLYIANYVDFSLADSPRCYASNSALDYCGPDAYTPALDQLLINRGNGQFDDRSVLLGGMRGAGLGVISGDFNGDHRSDLYVANDGDPNFLLINQGGQSLVDEALLSGTAMNGMVVAEASMGIASGDFDRDGDDDLFMTHLDGETNTLYLNHGDLLFEDQTQAMGLALSSKKMTGFGIAWVDINADRWPDLIAANGAVRILYDQLHSGVSLPLEQANQVFVNRGGRGFTEKSQWGGPAFIRPMVSRAIAVGDLDNDGDADFLLTNNHGPLQAFMRNGKPKSPWLGIMLRDQKRHPSMGATLALNQDKGLHTQRRDGSYLASKDPRILLTLDDLPRQTLVVTWPDGVREQFSTDQKNRYLDLVKGTGENLP